MSMIEIRNLSRNYGRTQALKNASIKLEANKIYGLLGRNGAGKTTLLNIITNKIFADSGEVLIDGESAVENDNAQSKVFHMTDKNYYPEDMRVREGIKWAKEFYPGFNMDYAMSLVKKFDLDVKKKIKNLSTGYGTIFKIILTLSSGAPIMLFDEPVLGLDANFRELFYKELIAVYGREARTIVISTHLIDEVSIILEEAIIIKEGEIILAQPVEDILQLAYTVSGESSCVDKYTNGKNVIREEAVGKYKASTVFQKRDDADREAIKELGLEITPAGLQELFISMTNS